jgi:hypothetical protein
MNHLNKASCELVGVGEVKVQISANKQKKLRPHGVNDGLGSEKSILTNVTIPVFVLYCTIEKLADRIDTL